MQERISLLHQCSSNVEKLACDFLTINEIPAEKPEETSTEYATLFTDRLTADEVIEIMDVIEHSASPEELRCINFQLLRQVVERSFSSGDIYVVGDNKECDVESIDSGPQ